MADEEHAGETPPPTDRQSRDAGEEQEEGGRGRGVGEERRDGGEAEKGRGRGGTGGEGLGLGMGERRSSSRERGQITRYKPSAEEGRAQMGAAAGPKRVRIATPKKEGRDWRGGGGRKEDEDRMGSASEDESVFTTPEAPGGEDDEEEEPRNRARDSAGKTPERTGRARTGAPGQHAQPLRFPGSRGPRKEDKGLRTEGKGGDGPASPGIKTESGGSKAQDGGEDREAYKSMEEMEDNDVVCVGTGIKQWSAGLYGGADFKRRYEHAADITLVRECWGNGRMMLIQRQQGETDADLRARALKAMRDRIKSPQAKHQRTGEEDSTRTKPRKSKPKEGKEHAAAYGGGASRKTGAYGGSTKELYGVFITTSNKTVHPPWPFISRERFMQGDEGACDATKGSAERTRGNSGK